MASTRTSCDAVGPLARTRRDCTHKQAGHRHGTRDAYVCDRCRCEDCTAANRAYAAERAQLRHLHRWNPDLPATPTQLVDATPARDHLRALMAAGMGLKMIAAKGRVAHGSISSILYGKPARDPKENRPPRARIRASLEARILAIRLDLADGARIDGTGTRRRLQALVAIGWSQRRLAQMLGVTQANLGRIIHGDGLVNRSTADRAARIYDDCWQAGPRPADRWERSGIGHALRCAARHGWVPPLAWDDDTIDDPAATPDLGEPAVTAGAALAEDVTDMLDAGEIPEAIAARLGRPLDSVYTALRRGGEGVVADRLVAASRALRDERAASNRKRVA